MVLGFLSRCDHSRFADGCAPDWASRREAGSRRGFVEVVLPPFEALVLWHEILLIRALESRGGRNRNRWESSDIFFPTRMIPGERLWRAIDFLNGPISVERPTRGGPREYRIDLR